MQITVQIVVTLCINPAKIENIGCYKFTPIEDSIVVNQFTLIEKRSSKIKRLVQIIQRLNRIRQYIAPPKERNI